MNEQAANLQQSRARACNSLDELLESGLPLDYIKSEVDWPCICCSVNLKMYVYQAVYSESEFKRFKAQYFSCQTSYNKPCEWGCTSQCIHGASTLLTWQQRGGKTPAFLYYLHLVRSFLKEQGDERYRLPILILALQKNEGDIVAQVCKFMPGQSPSSVIQLTGDAAGLKAINDFREKAQAILPELVAEQIIVGHYDSLGHANSAPFVAEMNRLKVLCLVLDQAEREQNEDTNRSKAVESIDRLFTVPVTGEIVNNPKRGDYVWRILQSEHAGEFERDGWAVPFKDCLAGKYVKEQAIAEGCARSGCQYFNRATLACQYGHSKESIPLHRHRLPSPVWPSEEQFVKFWDNPAHQHALNKQLKDKAHMSRLTREDLGFPKVELEVVEIEPTQAQKQNYVNLIRGIRTTLMFELTNGKPDNIQLVESAMSQSLSMNTLVMTAWLTQSVLMSPRMMAERSTGLWKLKQRVADAGSSLVLDQLDNKSAKIDKTIEYYQKLPSGDKLIVFSHYIGFLEELDVALKSKGIAHVMLTGETPKAKIEYQYLEFNRNPSMRIMLASDAASAGIPMQGGLVEGQTAHVLFGGFSYWNPSMMQECASRVYQMAMKSKARHVVLVSVVNGDSIDYRSAGKLAGKQSVASRIQDGLKTKGNVFEEFSTVGDFMDLLDSLEGKFSNRADSK